MGEPSGIEPPPDKKCSMAASSDCPGELVVFFFGRQGLVVHRGASVASIIPLFSVFYMCFVAVGPGVENPWLEAYFPFGKASRWLS